VRNRRVASGLACAAGVLATLALARDARALSACNAAQIVSQDPGCPSGPPATCTITKTFVIGNGCTLDFGSRAVVISGSGTLATGSSVVTLKAASLTLAPGSWIDGRGNGAAPLNVGGTIVIQTTGAVDVQRSGTSAGRIDVSADMSAGTMEIDAGGSITVSGRVLASNLSVAGAGGLLTFVAGGAVTFTAQSDVQAAGGSQSAGGGISVTSTGSRVEISSDLDVSGGGGGTVSVDAHDDVVLAQVSGNANGDAGSGASISVRAGTTVQLTDSISAKGSTANDGSFGACGGSLDADATFGDVIVTGNITVEGASPDGTGGSITLSSVGGITVQSTAALSTHGNGTFSTGGDFSVDANLDATIAGPVDVSGGSSAGSIDLLAGRDLTVTGKIDASGRNAASLGGTVLIAGGFVGSGTVSLMNTVDVGAGGCDATGSCGDGGSIDVFGCNVSVASTASLLARAPIAGGITLTGREHITVAGLLDATATSAGPSTPGTNTFQFPTGVAPNVVAGAIIKPLAVNSPIPRCTAPGQTDCLDPCPTCGNGIVEYPEQCDDGGGTALSCDGCSAFCAFEACNVSGGCAIDSCDPLLGCRHQLLPDGTPCPDGLVCNGNERCSVGACVPGVALDCTDPNPCTLDSCVEPTGCTHPPAPATTPCSDGNLCTVGDHCNGAGGCQPGAPMICDDGKECTTDACVPSQGCVYTNRTGACTDDGNACSNDVCASGLCTHPNKVNGTTCDDGQFCSVNDTCQGGVCTAGQARNCADTDPCTSDTCDEAANVCVHTPFAPCCGNGIPESGEACDDGNASNTDACLVGCIAARCGDGFVQTGVEQCDLGAANSNAPNASCRTDCRPARCGDGIVDTARGEQCDDGNTTAGDGCSPLCFLEPPPTAQFIGGKGSSLSDCVIEFAFDHPSLDRFGKPDVKQSCQNGDPSCDFGAGASECVFHLWLCANVHDPSLPACLPGGLTLGTPVQVDVSKPSAKDGAKRPEDAVNRAGLLAAAVAAQTSLFDACGPRVDVHVPLVSPTKSANKSIKLKARTTRNTIDSDGLKLYCLP
jgi:cysteine-rich repeat protein